jgi:hypothetical protein
LRKEFQRSKKNKQELEMWVFEVEIIKSIVKIKGEESRYP